MLGVGAVAVVGAIAVIAFAALGQGGGSAGVNQNGASAAASDHALPEYAHILGEPDAPVTVVEYSDIK